METIKVIEPRMAVEPDVQKNHVVLMGAQRVTKQVETADSWSQSQASWSISPPSTQTVVDRRVKIRCYFDVVADYTLAVGSNDAPRQFPIASTTDVLTVQINGESISDNIAEKIHALCCYGNDAQKRIESVSTAPSMPDGYQVYNDWTSYGSGKHPLGGYGESGVDEARGGFIVERISDTHYRFIVTEPIFMSPFNTGFSPEDEGMVNINQLNFNFRWGDLSRAWSHDVVADTGATSVTITHYQAPELLVTYLTPDLMQPIPEVQVLPYMKSQEYVKQMPLMAPEASTTIISDSIKLSQIPRKMMLFCKHSRQTQSKDTCDSFLKIENVSLLWNNQSGLFSSATEQDLYEISRSNGVNVSYPAFQKYRGSVFVAEFGKDIGLLDSESPGCVGQFTLQVTLKVKNVSTENFTPEFYLVFLNEGSFSVSENFARASIGNLTPEMVLQAKQSPELAHYKYEHLQGGSFFSSLKNIVSKVAHGVSKMARGPVGAAISAAFPEAAPIVGTIGALGKGKKGGVLTGGGRRRLSRK